MTFPIDVTSTQDTGAYDAPSSAKNFAGRLHMWVQGGTDQRRAFIYMARPFPLGATIPAVDLQLTQAQEATSASRTITVQLLTKQWAENKLTWDNFGQQSDPDAAGSNVGGPTASVTVTGAGYVGRVVTIPVTQLMQQVADGTPWYGFRVITDAASGIYFYSHDSTVGKPRLVGEYSTAPTAPTRLSPSAGRAVSVARPMLSFDAPNGMQGYRYRLYAGDGAAVVPPTGMSARFASFNMNGIAGTHGTFEDRVAGIAATIVTSGAVVVLANEANSTSSPDEPGQVVAALTAAGHSGWGYFIGPNLNVIFYDTAVFTALWEKTKDIHLGDGKYASAMLFQHISSGETVTAWSTHLLAGDENAGKRASATNILTGWLATLDGPKVGGGDLNNYSLVAGKPVAMLSQAGHLETRTLVDSVTNGTQDSFDGYGTNPAQGEWIDHLFVSGGPTPSATGLVDSGDSSDHNLIWSDIDYVTTAAAVGNLGEPIYDSGDIWSTVPQFYLPVDIADDGLMWWDVATFNGVDWSPASEPTFFRRKIKGDLAILNPAPAPDNVVTEASPPIIWESENQTAFQVLITDPDDPTIVRWDSRRQGGADQSITPPSALPLVTGQQYRVEVRFEDDVVREATPGDPVYQSAERLFTFDLSTDVAPVTGLTVAQVDERPWATIGFTMTEAADAVEVVRIDVERQTRLSLGTFTAADLHATGTQYAFVDREAAPQRDYSWEVRRIVNGVTSADNPATDAFRIVAKGVWLCSLDGSSALVVAGDGDDAAEVRWSPDENVELVRPLGGSRAHVVTHGIFGPTGRLDGFVEPWGDQSYLDTVATLEAMRPPAAPYGTPMILSQSDQCVRVFWTAVVDGARDEFGHEWFPLAADLNRIPRDAS